jgi:hypothetical protein
MSGPSVLYDYYNPEANAARLAVEVQRSIAYSGTQFSKSVSVEKFKLPV